jgi:hypothetical protein
MAKKTNVPVFIERIPVKRPGVHSKNASVGKRGYKKPYRGQGR